MEGDEIFEENVEFGQPENKCSKTKDITSTTNTVIGWFQAISNLLEKIGHKGMFSTMLVTFITVVLVTFMINPEWMIEKIENVKEQKHQEKIEERMTADPQVQQYLKEIKNEINCDRVFVFETHNGGNSLNGLPFLYVDMSYEETKKGVRPLENEYQNLRLSRYPFITTIYNENYWFGEVEKLSEIDPALFYRLSADEDKYIGFLVLYGEYYPAGCIGVTYSDTITVDRKEINRTLMKYGTKISPLLSNYNFR